MFDARPPAPAHDDRQRVPIPPDLSAHAVLESIDEGFLALDHEWCVTYFNARGEAILGARRGEIVGRSLQESFPDIVGSVFEREIERALRERDAIAFEAYHAPRDAWFAVRVHPGAHGLSIYFRDVTMRFRGQRELRASRAALVAVIDSIPSPAWFKDRDGRYLLVNRAMATAAGRTADELLGLTDVEIWGAERAGRYGADDARVLSQLRPVRVEEQTVERDGQVHWFETVKVPYLDASGELVGSVGIAHDISERLRSERHMRQVLDSLDAFVSVLAPDGTVTFMNAPALRANERTAEEAIGRPFAEVVDWRHPGRDALERALEQGRQGQRSRFEVVRPLPGGREAVTDFTLVPMFDDAGRVTHLVPSSTDVTERVRATEALRASEERFRALADFVPQLVWSTTPDGYHDYFNQRWYDYTGMPRPGEPGGEGEAPQGWNWKDYLHPDDYERSVAVWQHSLATGEPYHVEYRFRSAATGAYRWFIGRALPLRDDQGRIVRWFGTCTDVDAERQALDALHLSEERYHAAARATNDVLWDLDLRRHTLWVSDVSHAMLGSAPHEIATLDAWKERVHPDDRARVLAALDAFFDRGEENWRGEYRLRRGDGRYAHVLARGSVLRDREGTPVRMVGTLMDLTDRRQLEAELYQSQKMEAIGQLAGGVAHDFNNLLTVITGYADFISGELREDDPMRDDVVQVRKAADRAAGLTRQLLAFSRRQRLQPQVLDLNQTLAELEKMLGRLLGEDNHVVVAPGAGLHRVEADPGQIEQVIVNLAVNARDAMPNGGIITITTRNVEREVAADAAGGATRGEYVELTVRDTGVGISPDVLPHIFEPFFTTKGPGRGTGLGLSTVYGIVRQSGGTLEVSSTPGAGTELRIFLPASRGGGREQREPTGAEGIDAGGTETVLLVEDEAALRAIALRVLRRRGFQVIEASNGREALAILERRGEAVDIVVSDLVMPGMGGQELAREIAAMGLAPAILFMSGYTDDEIYRRSACPPDTAFLEKPFSVEALVRRVRAVLDAPRAVGAPAQRRS